MPDATLVAEKLRNLLMRLHFYELGASEALEDLFASLVVTNCRFEVDGLDVEKTLY